MSPVRDRYDQIADYYDGRVGDSVEDVGAAALLALAADVRGLRVLDVACGQGRMSRALARRGGHVVGVDVSEELLAKARASEGEEALGVRYVLTDVSSADALAGSRFDVVVANYGLTDIDDAMAEPWPGARWEARNPGAAPVPAQLVVRSLKA